MLLPMLLIFAAAAAPDCGYDKVAVLALNEDAFDQDLTKGWRALKNRGCLAEAADLLRDYRDANTRKRASILFWHEGQLRASLNQTEAAIALFEKSRKPEAQDEIGWNHYVDGSIAFLRHDRPALQQARDTLARLPAPKELPNFTLNGQKVPVAWPLNLNVLDGFLKCFDKPYAVAYSSDACTASLAKITVKDEPQR
ncbi:MAG: hypothetical protein WC803_01850 [Sphingomonas sp.]|jgi:hypothetical protein